MHQRLKEMMAGTIWKNFGAEIVEADYGNVLVRMPIKAEMTQLHGTVHGGILATLADMAMAAAVNSTVSEHEFTVTAEMKVNYLRAGKGNYLTARGTLIKRGKTLSHCQAEVHDDTGKQVCFAVATFYMFTKDAVHEKSD